MSLLAVRGQYRHAPCSHREELLSLLPLTVPGNAPLTANSHRQDLLSLLPQTVLSAVCYATMQVLGGAAVSGAVSCRSDRNSN